LSSCAFPGQAFVFSLKTKTKNLLLDRLIEVCLLFVLKLPIRGRKKRKEGWGEGESVSNCPWWLETQE
jgi:hypothetical protein